LLAFDTPPEDPLCPICHHPLADGHFVYHHPPQFQCDLCGSLYFKRRELDRHMERDHSSAADVIRYKPA
jgi:hypothetical protein